MPRDQIPAADEPTVLMAAALDDWWITTDPLTQFHAPAVARHVDDYLAHHGYAIAQTTPAAPSRLSIVTGLFIAAMAALAAAFAAHMGLWVWATVAAVATTLISHETVTDFLARRNARKHRR
jgi:hypothetical protein